MCNSLFRVVAYHFRHQLFLLIQEKASKFPKREQIRWNLSLILLPEGKIWGNSKLFRIPEGTGFRLEGTSFSLKGNGLDVGGYRLPPGGYGLQPLKERFPGEKSPFKGSACQPPEIGSAAQTGIGMIGLAS